MSRAVYRPVKDGTGKGEMVPHDEAIREGIVLTREQRQEVMLARREAARQLPAPTTLMPGGAPVIVQPPAPVNEAQNEQILEMGGVTCRNCGSAFMMNDLDDMRNVARQLAHHDPDFLRGLAVGLPAAVPPRAGDPEPAEDPPEPADPEPPAKAKAKAKAKTPAKKRSKAKPPAKPKQRPKAKPPEVDLTKLFKGRFTGEQIIDIVQRGEKLRSPGVDPTDFSMQILTAEEITEGEYNRMVELFDQGSLPAAIQAARDREDPGAAGF